MELLQVNKDKKTDEGSSKGLLKIYHYASIMLGDSQ